MNGTSSIRARRELPPGIAANLLCTESGSAVVYIEAVLLPGGAGITVTGQRGDEIADRVRAAQSQVWSRAGELGIHPSLFRRYGLHVHAPDLAKDQAAAGLALAVALFSLYSGCPVPPELAVTGETTLTGLVLPVTDVGERIAAGRLAGFEKIIVPRDHQKDLETGAERDMDLSFVFADSVHEALEAALPRWMSHLAALRPSL